LTVAAGFTVKTEEATVADVAVTVTPVALATLPVAAENVALLLPAETVTEDGTDTTAELPLASEITTPPVGAGAAVTTVPVELFPLTTELAENCREDTATVAGFTATDTVPDFVESSLLVAFTVAVVAVAGAV
jgi:hypothetical protein